MITAFEHIGRWVGRTPAVDWEAVFATELPRVFNYLRYHGLDDPTAEDLTAGTFEKAWRARDTYRQDRSAVTTWLITIARRTMIDYYRTYRPTESLEALAERRLAPSTGEGLEPVAEQREEVERLRRLLAALSQDERELVALKYGAELTNRAIARQTGLSESNVGTRLHRVVQLLRAQLEHES